MYKSVPAGGYVALYDFREVEAERVFPSCPDNSAEIKAYQVAQLCL